MGDLRLRKFERLCSRTAVDRLFAEGHSIIAYPLRAVWLGRKAGDQPVRMLVNVPKKKHRHAVDRVLLRRRIREAYRLHRHTILTPALEAASTAIDVAFLFLSNERTPYSTIEARMCELLSRIAQQVVTPTPSNA